MISQSLFKDPFGRAILISLCLHVVLFAFISRLSTAESLVIPPDAHEVKISFLTVEKQTREAAASEIPDDSVNREIDEIPDIEKIPVVTVQAEDIPVMKSPAMEFPSEASPAGAELEPVSLPVAEDVPHLQGISEQPENMPSGLVSESGPTDPSLDDINMEGARMPDPTYPSMARQMGWEGDVSIIFTINSKGRAENIVIDQSSGHELLDQSVLTTVKKHWRFPRGGDPLRVRKDFSFRLI